MRLAQVLLAGCVLAGCASNDPVYDPIIPFSATGPTSFAVPAGAMPEKAVALDVAVIPSYIGEPVETSRSYYTPVYVPATSAGAGASAAGAAAAGGIIALLLIAAVESSIDSGRDEKINKFLEAQKFDGRKHFYDTLKAELAKSGHTLQVQANAKDAFPAQATKLNVEIAHYGYQIVGGPWAPTALAKVTITSADGKQTYLKDSIAAGGPYSAVGPWSTLGNETIILPYDPAHIMVDEDAITLGDPAVAIGGLKFTLESLARGVADLVRHEALPPAPEPTPAAAPADVAAVGL